MGKMEVEQTKMAAVEGEANKLLVLVNVLEGLILARQENFCMVETHLIICTTLVVAVDCLVVLQVVTLTVLVVDLDMCSQETL